MNTVAIQNLDVNVWTQKSDLTLWNFPCSLTQPKITTRIPFGHTEIEYDIIKDYNKRMECVEYNTYFGRNVLNVDDIEDFEIL